VKNEEARVHFIPTLKDGVFVTLCAPLVIKNAKNAIFGEGRCKYEFKIGERPGKRAISGAVR
jgi:hypothetical protein